MTIQSEIVKLKKTFSIQDGMLCMAYRGKWVQAKEIDLQSFFKSSLLALVEEIERDVVGDDDKWIDPYKTEGTGLLDPDKFIVNGRNGLRVLQRTRLNTLKEEIRKEIKEGYEKI